MYQTQICENSGKKIRDFFKLPSSFKKSELEVAFLVLISHDLKWAIITHKLSPNFVLPSSNRPK